MGDNFNHKKNQSPQDRPDPVELEMILQNSSYGHEYARLQLENVRCSFKKSELLEQLEGYKKAYFSARRCLEINYPERLEKLEEDLQTQKKEVFAYTILN